MTFTVFHRRCQDAWAALVDFAEQSRQCATTVTLAQIVRSPATVSPLQSLSTTQTAVREICCDMAVTWINKMKFIETKSAASEAK